MVHPIVVQYIAKYPAEKQGRFKAIVDALEKGMQSEVLKPKNIGKLRTEISSHETYKFPVFQVVNIKTGEREGCCGVMGHSAQISIYAPDCNGWPPLIGGWCEEAGLSYGLACMHWKDATKKQLPAETLSKIGAYAFKMVTNPKFKFVRTYCGHDLKKAKAQRTQKIKKVATKAAASTGAKKKKPVPNKNNSKAKKTVVVKKGTKPKKVALKKKAKK